MILQDYKSIWDKVSIGASVICTIHCIMLPLAFGTITLLGIEVLENPFLELATIGVSALLGGYAIYKGYNHFHKNKGVLILFAVGIILLIAGNLLQNEIAEMSLKLAGAVSLILAHLLNHRRCKLCVINNKKN